MKTKILMLFGAALLPVLAMAAQDFSGTWAIDRGRSDPAPDPSYWLTRTEPDPPRDEEGILTVAHDGGSLQVAEFRRPLRKYTLDGKEQVVATDTGVEQATVSATLQDESIVIETTKPYGGMPGNAVLTTKEVWSLSPDGDELTITTTHNSPANPHTFKQVFERR